MSPIVLNAPEMVVDPKPKGKRGFASMTPERRKEIAAMGGRAVPADKRGFSVHNKLAVEAGRKGGLSVNPANRVFSKNRELAKSAGRAGGKATGHYYKPVE
jgi:general stress protein YciG